MNERDNGDRLTLVLTRAEIARAGGLECARRDFPNVRVVILQQIPRQQS